MLRRASTVNRQHALGGYIRSLASDYSDVLVGVLLPTIELSVPSHITELICCCARSVTQVELTEFEEIDTGMTDKLASTVYRSTIRRRRNNRRTFTAAHAPVPRTAACVIHCQPFCLSVRPSACRTTELQERPTSPLSARQAGMNMEILL